MSLAYFGAGPMMRHPTRVATDGAAELTAPVRDLRRGFHHQPSKLLNHRADHVRREIFSNRASLFSFCPSYSIDVVHIRAADAASWRLAAIRLPDNQIAYLYDRSRLPLSSNLERR
jgi:hypothetical protein